MDGLPGRDLAGETFAGRVGASLLRAVGLPELIASGVDDYVTRAIDLAGDAAARGRLRDYLTGPGRASALFDVARSARALEAAYVRMVRDGGGGRRAPIRIEVPEDASVAQEGDRLVDATDTDNLNSVN